MNVYGEEAMTDVTALRYSVEDNGDGETVVEYDTLIAVEVMDPEASRGIDVHLSPRTDYVETVSIGVDEAWALVRELARAATTVENERP